METIDSKQQKLDIPEIIIRAVQQLTGAEDAPMQAALLAIAEEGGMDSADTVQIGNTVFLAHRGKGDNKNKMAGRAFNIDTGRNFIANSVEYLQYLQDKNITHYSTEFEGDRLLPAMRMLQKRLTKTEDSALYIGVTEDDEYLIYIKLGEEPVR